MLTNRHPTFIPIYLTAEGLVSMRTWWMTKLPLSHWVSESAERQPKKPTPSPESLEAECRKRYLPTLPSPDRSRQRCSPLTPSNRIAFWIGFGWLAKDADIPGRGRVSFLNVRQSGSGRRNSAGVPPHCATDRNASASLGLLDAPRTDNATDAEVLLEAGGYAV